nr:unnamed protein product [Callosobruchus analis]
MELESYDNSFDFSIEEEDFYESPPLKKHTQKRVTFSKHIYSKTLSTTLARKSHIGLSTVEMKGLPRVEFPFVKLLGSTSTTTIAKTASQKLGVLFRCKKLYTPEQLLLLYKAQIRSSLEYCSHKRTVRLIDVPKATKDLHSLQHRRTVADLTLFDRFYHGSCSNDLSQIIISKTVRTRITKEASRAHPYQVEVPIPRTGALQYSFF